LLWCVIVALIVGKGLRAVEPEWVGRARSIGGIQIRVSIQQRIAEAVHGRSFR